MAGTAAEPYGAWYDALDALTAVVKLFRDGVLTPLADTPLLQRLERAEEAARPGYRGGTAAWSRGPGSPSIGEVLLEDSSIPRPVPRAPAAAPGAAELGVLGAQLSAAASGLDRGQRQLLTRRYAGATTAVLNESPRATQLLKGFRSVLVDIFAGAVGEELVKQTDHIIAIIQARGH